MQDCRQKLKPKQTEITVRTKKSIFLQSSSFYFLFFFNGGELGFKQYFGEIWDLEIILEVN